MYRRERGVCRICWTEQDETIDFQLSGGSAAGGMYKLENVDTFIQLKYFGTYDITLHRVNGILLFRERILKLTVLWLRSGTD